MSDINWGLITSGATFQDLMCALIRMEDHEARLYVRPGKDYAQDARSGDGRIIYQMKFHQTNASAIADAKAEAGKIATYQKTPGVAEKVWQGVGQWILVTNVAFNPSDAQKWDDEVKREFKALGLEASYWEKSVVETYLHKYPDLKQAYFGGETRVFLGIAEAHEVVQSREFHHPKALSTSYQGRARELAQYKEFLVDNAKKILVIHGSGGIGKTRFLLEGAKTQAFPEGWQVFWANLETMTASSSWFMGIVAERPTLILMDEPDDTKALQILVEQISGGRAKTWKVAIAVRSAKDPVLNYVQGPRICQIVQELPLESLEKNGAVAFCQELLELGDLQSRTQEWKDQAATWIAQQYDYYPIWMAIAINLLESKGNLDVMPQKSENLAREYLEEICKQQQDIPSEQLLNLLRWTALLDTVNREDTAVMKLIQAKVGCRNSTELQRYFDSLITHRAVFGRGARDRLLEIKPDVLSDYILRSWLTYSTIGNSSLKVSSEAEDLVQEISEILDYSEDLSAQKLILKGIARFELIQRLSNNPINLLESFLDHWHDQILKMNARRQLVSLSILDEFSFAHVSEVLNLLRDILKSPSESETVSTIFGERIIAHDDVILALPGIIYDVAPHAQSPNEQIEIIALLCDLVIAEHQIKARRPQQGLPNDGKRAETILRKIIIGGPEFYRDFEPFAFQSANDLLDSIFSSGAISEFQTLHLEFLVKPLLGIEKEHTHFDGRTVKIKRWFISPDSSEWEIRDSLRTKIKEILSAQKLQPAQAVIFWNLLRHTHKNINRALIESSPNRSDKAALHESFRSVLAENLRWIRDFLQLHHSDIQELTAARKIWNWHCQFDQDAELKAIAEECEAVFMGSELFPQYSILLDQYDYQILDQWSNDTSSNLIASDSTRGIQGFVQNGVKFLGNPDEVRRLLIVADKLGLKAQQFPIVRDFVEAALKLDVKEPEFQFAVSLCKSWVWTIRRDEPSATVAVLEQLLQWVNSQRERISLVQAIYESGWLTLITEPEVVVVLKQQEHFLQAGLAPRFLHLLGGLFFSSPGLIKSAIERIFESLDPRQLSNGINAFLQPLYYSVRSLILRNADHKFDPALKIWILDQVLRLPDIDELDDTWQEDLFKLIGNPDLSWLIDAIEKRVQMYKNSDGRSIQALPHRRRLSQWITPVSPEQAGDVTMRTLIEQLLSYADSSPALRYGFPRYLVDVDPCGIITPDLVVEKLLDPQVRGNPERIVLWSKFAGYYIQNSPAWRKIAHTACLLSVHQIESTKYKVFYALTNPDPKIWGGNIGEVSPIFTEAVETAQQQLESEADPTLIPFWQWRLQSTEAELIRETERVNEEIEEW